MNCVYRVFIPYGRAMIIYFNDFYLENASNCRYDYLRIANHNHTIGTYCGQQSGLNVRVTGNYAVITFRSDNVIQKRGFQLYFSYFPLENSTGPPYATNRPHTTHRSYTTHRPRTNPPPGCSDKGGSNFCAGFAHGNFCMVYLNFTQEFCAKTCGFCEVPCVDAIVCPPLSQSFCLSNHNWSMQNCRKSCGFCTASTSGPGTSPPITSQQHTSQPDYSEHSTSQPSITQASSSNPGTSQSSTSQPSTSQPSTSQPGTSQPGSSQPGTPQQHTPQPSTFQPDSSQPSSSQPSASQSNTSQASTSQSSTSQSGNSQPGSSQPGNSQPNTPQPGTSQPSTFQPVTSKPRTSQPDSSQTSTFQPSTSQRGTSQLATSQPESSQPGSSQASPSQKGTSQPGTYATTRPTPSDEEEQESVMLKVRGLQIKKWDNEMENTFKTEVARAATEYCTTDGAQCQLSSKSSRKKRSSDITFSDNMVHILPGYPTQSPDDPDVALLAFYLSIRQGLLNNTVVNKDVLKDIVNEDISTIGRSMGGTIVSVEPLPSTTEKLQDTNEDEENDGNSKATNVIIGASVGGVLFFVIIVAAFVSCKRSNRGARIRHVESQDTLDRNTINARATNESSGENGDHVRVVEHIVEIEGIEAPCSSREQPNKQPQKNATKSTQSEPCQTDIAYPSVVQVQRESPDKLERLKCNELENVKERKEAKPLSNVGNKTDGSKEKAALKSYSDVHNGEQVQQAKENSDRHLPNEEDQHQDSRL